MRRVSQSVDQVFGRLNVRANRHGDHLSTLLGGRYHPRSLLYSPVRTFPPRSNLRGRDMTVPKPLPLPQPAAVMSLCVRSRIRTRTYQPGSACNWQTSRLTGCATNPVGIRRWILNYLNKSWLRNHLKWNGKEKPALHRRDLNPGRHNQSLAL